LTSLARTSSASAPRLPDADQTAFGACGRTRDLPVPAQGAYLHARVFDHAGSAQARAIACTRVAFRVGNHVGTRDYETFAAQWLAYSSPYRRFARALASTPARLGADVDRYSFIVMDLHHLLLAGLPAHYRWRMGQAASVAKRDLRVGASGRPSSHAARRSRFSAAAVATFCRCIFASPR